MFGRDNRASFTLIELLIVIAVVAVLSVVVVLVLNPAELLKQARDSNRIADMDTLNKAVILYLGDRGGSLGTASTTYFSLIDAAATTTAGTNCAGVGLTPPTGWNYHCAASSTARKLDGTGWIPLNFSSITFSPPMGALPVDPTNTSSSGLYYMYTPGTTTYALAATLNSSKYLAAKGNGDGGVEPARLETGSNLALIAQSQGLIGWWPFDDEAATPTDFSGSGNNGTWNGAGVHTTTTSKVGGRAGNFNGSNDYVSVPDVPSLNLSTFSIMAWIRPSDVSGDTMVVAKGNGSVRNYAMQLGNGSPYLQSTFGGPSQWQSLSFGYTQTVNTWTHLVATFDGTTMNTYVNGALSRTGARGTPDTTSTIMAIGRLGGASSDYFPGVIDDVRIYSRALSAAEVLAIYNVQK